MSHLLEDVIRETCDAIRRLPATDSPLTEMTARGIDRGKYDATLPIQHELAKVLDFLEPFDRGEGVAGFRTMPRSLTESLSKELDSVKRIAEQIPINCQAQTTNVVPPSYVGSEQRVAERVDAIFSRIYSQLISFRSDRRAFFQVSKPSAGASTAEIGVSEPSRNDGSKIKDKVVITLHGIRTRAKWQKTLDQELARAGFIPVSLDYGWFSVLPFLSQRQRDKKVAWFIEEYKNITERYPRVLPSVVAHSLGTYIIARAISESAGLVKFDKIIFCGSIVVRTFPWSRIIDEGLTKEVLNDCGYLDLWAGAAGLALPDAEASGKKGFVDLANGKVQQRFHSAWRHGHFFFSLNYQGRWIPFLKGESVSDVDFKRHRHLPLLWILLGLLLLTLLIFGIESYVSKRLPGQRPRDGQAHTQNVAEIRDENYRLSPNLTEETEPPQEPPIQQQEPLKVDRVRLNQCKPDNLHVVVSVFRQRAYLICGKEIVADAPISSGKRTTPTPLGRFKVLKKDADHYSLVYGDFVDAHDRVVRSGVTSTDSAPKGTHFAGSPMKWFLQLTEDDFGLFQGILAGYPASHGGIRMSSLGAQLFFEYVEIGSTVEVVRDF